MTATVHRNMKGTDKPVPYGFLPAYTSGMWFAHCPQHGYIGKGHAAWHHNPMTAQAAADRHNEAEHRRPPREWVGVPEMDAEGVLPLDLMPMWEGTYCEAGGGDYICTRPKGHTGRHAASNGEVIVAVWE